MVDAKVVYNLVYAHEVLLREVVDSYEKKLAALIKHNEFLEAALSQALRGNIGNAVPERRPETKVSRDGEPRGDKRVDSGTLGQGDEGQEAPREEVVKAQDMGAEQMNAEDRR